MLVYVFIYLCNICIYCIFHSEAISKVVFVINIQNIFFKGNKKNAPQMKMEDKNKAKKNSDKTQR